MRKNMYFYAFTGYSKTYCLFLVSAERAILMLLNLSAWLLLHLRANDKEFNFTYSDGLATLL